MPKTAVVTGASGYIAKHILKQLLDEGWHVRGTVRSANKAGQTRTALAAAVLDPSTLDARLDFVELDLGRDDGWDTALTGADVLIHTASPFPIEAPKDEDTVIRPAVDGALRAMKAAHKAGVHRVVMTSSSVAIMNCDLPAGRSSYTEADWTDIDDPRTNAYAKSKTLAERAAWDFVGDHPEMQLTVINPAFVQGTPLDTDIGTSVQVIQRILDAKDPALPDIAFVCVDVQDIARMHVLAIDTPAAIGNRYIGANGTLSFREMAQIVKAAHPGRKIVTRVAPHWLIRILARFDPSIRTIVPMLGLRDTASSDAAVRDLGITFRDPAEAIRATANFLIKHNLVKSA